MEESKYEGATDMDAAPLILVVDDDPHITEVLVFSLSAAGYEVMAAGDSQGALAAFERRPALVILDINLPGQDGLWICQELRKTSQTPIIFLSARDEEVDRVMGLTIGGDDYVTKPFSPRELVARVKAILRRPQNIAADPSARAASFIPAAAPVLKRGKLSLDPESFTAFWDGLPVELTATEFQLLKTLISRPSKVFTRDELLTQVYQDTVVSDRTIDSHILHIRKKFGAGGAREVIQTQHGVGYKLASNLD